MRNDLVVFTFEGEHGSEILLEPTLPGMLAAELRQLLIALRPDELEAYFDIKLAALRPGSFRIGYLVQLVPEDTRETIAFTANLATALAGVFALLHFVGTSAGYLVPSEPQRQPTADEIMAIDLAREDPNVASCYRRVLTVVTESGARRVTLSVPDHAMCELKLEQAHEARLGGSARTISTDTYGSVSGDLKVSREVERVRIGNDVIRAQIATLELGGEDLPVVMIWQSKRPKPLGGGASITISGKLQRFDDARVEPVDVVGPLARGAVGVLFVERQRVEE